MSIPPIVLGALKAANATDHFVENGTPTLIASWYLCLGSLPMWCAWQFLASPLVAAEGLALLLKMKEDMESSVLNAVLATKWHMLPSDDREYQRQGAALGQQVGLILERLWPKLALSEQESLSQHIRKRTRWLETILDRYDMEEIETTETTDGSMCYT